MSVHILGVSYFLYVPVHLKHISKGSFQYSQYCESEDFLFQHLHFITHVSTGILEEKKVLFFIFFKKAHMNRLSSRKWPCVNKREMELIFQMCIQVPFLEKTSSKQTI